MTDTPTGLDCKTLPQIKWEKGIMKAEADLAAVREELAKVQAEGVKMASTMGSQAAQLHIAQGENAGSGSV